ncbi:MAG: glutathione S-transferase N-terminal domain-containing protein [Kofleriaceae bacterium]
MLPSLVLGTAPHRRIVGRPRLLEPEVWCYPLAMAFSLDVATSWMASVARGGAGMTTHFKDKTPDQLLELYEFEACPFCRIAREALSELDLDAMIFPCPNGGTRFRPLVEQRGGKAQFPFLVDPNTGETLYESADIARYLATHYGSPSHRRSTPGVLAKATSAIASAFRPRKGRVATPSRLPEQPLELYSFEASPYCRIAREALSSLELPYLLHNVGKQGARRDAFVARSGKMQVPYLVDPNTSVAMFESADIVRYLEQTYRV